MYLYLCKIKDYFFINKNLEGITIKKSFKYVISVALSRYMLYLHKSCITIYFCDVS